MRHWIKRIGSTLLALAFTLSTGAAYAQGTIKIMYTDPLSGPFAQVGDQNLQQFKYIIDYINGRGGALGKKFELVSFDNKSQPSEALLALKSATDQNIPDCLSRLPISVLQPASITPEPTNNPWRRNSP